MSAGKRTIKVDILGDSKGGRSAFAELDASAGKSEGLLGKLGGAFSGVAKIAGGFVVAQGLLKLPGIFSDAVSAGSNLNESLNAVNQIFGQSAQAILDWGKNNATSFGLSQRAFNDLAVPLGAGLKNAGLSMDDVSKNTIALTERAADMASVFNTDVDEALAAIQAGLRGEADPLERFGVGLSAAAVEAEAMAMTGKTVAGSLTDQEKALARVNLIMRQTEDTAGDFTNTSDGAANSARIAAARQEELAAAIGTKLLPVQQALTQAKLAFLTVLADKVIPAVSVLADRMRGPLSHAFSLVRDGVVTFVQALQGNWADNENIHGLHRGLGNLGLIIREQVIPAVKDIAAFVTGTVIPALHDLGRQGVELFREEILPPVRELVSFLRDNLPAAIGFAKDALGGIRDALGPIFSFLVDHKDTVIAGLTGIAIAFGIWTVATTAQAIAMGALSVAMAPVTLIILGIGAAAALLYEAWTNNWGGIQEKTAVVVGWLTENIPPAFEAIQLAVSGVVDFVKTLIAGDWSAAWSQLGAVVSLAGEFLTTTALPLLWEGIQFFLTDTVPKIAGKLAEWGAQFIAWVAPQIPPLLAELGRLLVELGGWLLDTALPTIASHLAEWGLAFVAWVGPQIPPLLSALAGLLVELGTWLLGTALPEITAKLGEWGLAFVSWVAPQIPPLMVQLGVLLMTIAAWMISEALPKLVEKLVEWGGAFLGFVAKDVLPELPGKLGGIITSIGGWVTEKAEAVASEAAGIGVAVLQGIASGISDNAQAIVGAAIDAALSLIPSWARKVLGIESPSKVMIPVGHAIVEGVAVGIIEATPHAEQAAYEAGQAVGNSYASGVAASQPIQLPGGVPGMAPIGGGGGVPGMQPITGGGGVGGMQPIDPRNPPVAPLVPPVTVTIAPLVPPESINLNDWLANIHGGGSVGLGGKPSSAWSKGGKLLPGVLGLTDMLGNSIMPGSGPIAAVAAQQETFLAQLSETITRAVERGIERGLAGV